MDNSFSTLINSAGSTIVLLPTKPSFDQVAAALGFYLSRKQKANVSISCTSQMIVEFNQLVGVDEISQEAGNKNLIIKFAGFPTSDIEKVSYDIEGGEFRLTVIPKAGLSSPKKEQIQLSYSGVSGNLIILVGGHTISDFPVLSSLKLGETTIAHLGVRQLDTTGFEGILSFARPASTVSELIAGLISENGFYLDADIATNLIAGISEGTGSYKSEYVTADTFQTVANLMKAGGRRIKKEPLNRGVFPPGAIPGQAPDMKLKKQVGEVGQEKPPQDWLEPKIYKGTSVS